MLLHAGHFPAGHSSQPFETDALRLTSTSIGALAEMISAAAVDMFHGQMFATKWLQQDLNHQGNPF